MRFPAVPPLPITQLISNAHSSIPIPFRTCSTPVRPLRTLFDPIQPLCPKFCHSATLPLCHRRYIPFPPRSFHTFSLATAQSFFPITHCPRSQPLAETSFAVHLPSAFVDQPFFTVAQSQIKRLKPIRRAQEAAEAASLGGQRDQLSSGEKLRRPSGLPPITPGTVERKETALR